MRKKILYTILKPAILRRYNTLLLCRFFQHDFVPRDPNTRPTRYKYPLVYAPYRPRPPPSDKVTDLAKRVAALPQEERAQISATLLGRIRHPRTEWVSEEEMDGGCGKRPGGGGEEEEEAKAEEKVVFDVRLEKFETAAKIKVIKEVRAMTGLGLKEAKELVEKAPVLVKRGVTKEEADLTVDKICSAGGSAAAV